MLTWWNSCPSQYTRVVPAREKARTDWLFTAAGLSGGARRGQTHHLFKSCQQRDGATRRGSISLRSVSSLDSKIIHSSSGFRPPRCAASPNTGDWMSVESGEDEGGGPTPFIRAVIASRSARHLQRAIMRGCPLFVTRPVSFLSALFTKLFRIRQQHRAALAKFIVESVYEAAYLLVQTGP